MGRISATVLGIAILAGGAIFVSRAMLRPATEEVERREPVLTGAHDPRLYDCRVLEDTELPEGLEPPSVGEDYLWLRVVVFYPGVAEAPAPQEHVFDKVNGDPAATLRPKHAEGAPGEDGGAFVHLTFRIDREFRFARLARDGKAVLEKVSVE
jgi:hypothetical protein